MNEITGNIIDLAEQGHFNAIIHGCNCFGNMGAGLAKEIKQRYHCAYKVDYRTIKGDKSKLGTYSSVLTTSNVNPDYKFYIINAYTQFRYGGRTINADYRAIRKVMRAVAEDFKECVLGIPLIGAGLAGGDWSLIKGIIEEELVNNNYTIVHFKK